MIFKNFRLNVVFHLVLIIIAIALSFYILAFSTMKLLAVFTLLALIYEVFRLIRYVETTSRDFALFLESIKYSDVSQTFSRKGMGNVFDRLYDAFREVNEQFRQARLKTEENYRYLHTVFHHVPIGLISYFPDGKVDIINSTAKKLLRLPRLKNVNNISKDLKPLREILINAESGEKKLLSLTINRETAQLMVSVTRIKLRDREFSIVSMQNIKSELETREVESWQKLIRILTHEIMNSITPISSLTSTVNDIIRMNLGDIKNGTGINEEAVSDLENALESIKKRSQGLIDFVANYRSLTLIPEPKKEVFEIKPFFKRIAGLMQKKIKDSKIDFRTKVTPENMKLYADPNQMEQVMINLLLNSILAVKDAARPTVKISAYVDPFSKAVIEIEDNGRGIPQDAQDKVFLPFFTTHENGSGIGLSLSKQIINMHNASINFQSIPDSGTTFYLKF